MITMWLILGFMFGYSIVGTIAVNVWQQRQANKYRAEVGLAQQPVRFW